MRKLTHIDAASRVALAIHDVACALKTSAWVLVYLAGGDSTKLLIERLRDVIDGALNIAYAPQYAPFGEMLDERTALAEAGHLAEAVNTAASGLRTIAWAAAYLGDDESRAEEIMKPLTEAAHRAWGYSRELRARLSALPHPGEEAEK